jgi:hypothetical protein
MLTKLLSRTFMASLGQCCSSQLSAEAITAFQQCAPMRIRVPEVKELALVIRLMLQIETRVAIASVAALLGRLRPYGVSFKRYLI